MDVRSTYKFARISARKARDVAREIQGLPVSEALDILQFTPRKAAHLFTKTMKTALADAENNFELPVEGLFVKSAVVGEGPSFRRLETRARGSASVIQKRTSHLTVVLSDEEAPEPKAKKRARSTRQKGRDRKGDAERGGGRKESPPAKKVAAAPAAETAGEESGAATPKSEVSEGGRLDEARGWVYDSPPSEVDDLARIGGVGPKIEEKLNSAGIYEFEQIANWTDENIREFDDLLAFSGRIERDEWVEKAKALHEEKYGK